MISELFGPTTCTSRFHGPEPFRKYECRIESAGEFTDLEFDLDSYNTAFTAAQLALALCSPLTDKVSRCRGVYDLVDARSIQSDLLVISVADVHESEDVVSASLWLNGKFSSRHGEGLGDILRRLLVTLGAVVYLEWRCTVHDERSRDTGIARAGLRSVRSCPNQPDSVPFMDLLPFDLGRG